MANRIKETLDAYAQVIGKETKENVFSPEYLPQDEHEIMRKEYSALTAQIIDWLWQHVDLWREENPQKLIVRAADARKTANKKAIKFSSLAHLQYAFIPENMLFKTPQNFLLRMHGPYKKAELTVKNACSITVSYQTQVWFDMMKSSKIPVEKKEIWNRWEAVVKKREVSQPEAVHGRRRQIEWGFMHGWGSITQITRQVVDAFYDTYEHLPIKQEDFIRVKNDIKNYLIHLSLLTTPLEIFFETLSHKANESLIPFFAYDTDVNPPELNINVPDIKASTRQTIYNVLYEALGRTNTDKTLNKNRLGCPVSLHIPGRHQPATVSRVADFYLDTYQKLLQHPQATEWYQEELVQKYEKLMSYL